MREAEGRDRWLTRAEVEALCRAARVQKFGPMLEDFIRLAVNTGCRREEMLGLEWRRVDFANRLICRRHPPKAGKRRSIPINEGAMAALKRRMAFRSETSPECPWVLPEPTEIEWFRYQPASSRPARQRRLWTFDSRPAPHLRGMAGKPAFRWRMFGICSTLDSRDD